jgi:capsular polysaccharide biosynthesis protein
VYLGRNQSVAGSRAVVNEGEVVRALSAHLPPHLQLVVLGHTDAFSSISHLQLSWQRYARVLHRAIALIAPHGGGLNNLLWIPEDCHVIEFNLFPDEKENPPVRSIFFNAWWAKTPSTSTARYWVIKPTKRSKSDFYGEHMRVSPREVLKVLSMINLVKDESWKSLPEEKHEFW